MCTQQPRLAPCVLAILFSGIAFAEDKTPNQIGNLDPEMADRNQVDDDFAWDPVRDWGGRRENPARSTASELV